MLIAYHKKELPAFQVKIDCKLRTCKAILRNQSTFYCNIGENGRRDQPVSPMRDTSVYDEAGVFIKNKSALSSLHKTKQQIKKDFQFNVSAVDRYVAKNKIWWWCETLYTGAPDYRYLKEKRGDAHFALRRKAGLCDFAEGTASIWHSDR